MTTLREDLADWTDWNDAVVSYGIVLGLFARAGRDADRVVLTDNPVSDALRAGLLALVGAGVIEQRQDDDEQFRWVLPDRGLDDLGRVAAEGEGHGPLGGPAVAAAPEPTDEPPAVGDDGLRDLAAVIAGKGFVVGDPAPAVTDPDPASDADPDAGPGAAVEPEPPAPTRPADPVARRWWRRG